MEENKKFTLAKMNLILIAVAFGIIVLGFILMTGSSTEVEFNPDIFSTRRIVVAPTVTLIGFLSIIYAVIRKPKDN